MSRVRYHLLDNCKMCKTVLIDCSCSWGEFYVWFYAHAMIGMVLVVNTLLLCPLFRANCCSISSAFTVMSWWFITYLFYCFILFCSCQNIQIFHVAKQIPRSNIQKRKQTVHQFCTTTTTTTTTDWRQRLWLVVWSCAFRPIALKTYRYRLLCVMNAWVESSSLSGIWSKPIWTATKGTVVRYGMHQRGNIWLRKRKNNCALWSENGSLSTARHRPAWAGCSSSVCRHDWHQLWMHKQNKFNASSAKQGAIILNALPVWGLENPGNASPDRQRRQHHAECFDAKWRRRAFDRKIAFNWCVFPLRVLRFRFDLAAAAAVFVSILRAIVYYPNRRTTEKGREILLIL